MPHTRAARMEMLYELMAPIEDAKGDEEITIKDGAGAQDAEPLSVACGLKFLLHKALNVIAARTFHSGAGAGGVLWAVAGEIRISPRQARASP